MRFVVDGMLGKLTRWLRLLGHDVEYSNNMEDKDLIGIAKKEKRVLLTRDFQLYQQAVGKGLDALYVEGQTEPERLAEISKRFSIRLEVDMKISRCSKCNTIVKPILKEKIADKVEKNTLAHYDEFWMCPKCEQVYWQGAHSATFPGTQERRVLPRGFRPGPPSTAPPRLGGAGNRAGHGLLDAGDP